MRLGRFGDRRGGTERGAEGTGETTAGGGSASPDDSAEEAAGGEDLWAGEAVGAAAQRQAFAPSTV